jgi:hypothetical protein
MSLKIKLFEDFNDTDNNSFLESILELESISNKIISVTTDDDYYDLIPFMEDNNSIMNATKDLIESDSKLLKSQCLVLKASLTLVIGECTKFDTEDINECSESCKRLLIDCANFLDLDED